MINKISILFFVLLFFASPASAVTYLSNGSYYDTSFSKVENTKYTVKLTASSGDCDLYGHHAGAPRRPTYYHKASEKYGFTDEEFSFESTSQSTYYVSVYGYDNCSFTLNITSSLLIPNLPTRLSPSNNIQVTDTTPFIDWSAPSGATSYKFFLYNATTDNWVNNGITVSSSNYTSQTLTGGDTYRWWVAACNSYGCSPVGSGSSNYSVFTVSGLIPNLPTRLSPSNNIQVTDTTPFIDWSAPSGATSYKFFLYNATTDNWVNNGITVSSSNYTSQTLTGGDTYRWWVAACNSYGCSPVGSGSSNYSVFTVELNVTDAPPEIIISTPGSSETNNQKAGDFNLDIDVTDDIGLKAIAYQVFTSDLVSTGLIDSISLSGLSDSASFIIDAASLNVGA